MTRADTDAGLTRGVEVTDAEAVGAQAILDPRAVDDLREDVGRVAREVVTAIMAEVPSYDAPFQGRMGQVIERAVQVSLESFIDLAGQVAPGASGSGSAVGVGVSAAHELGQVEARAGRPVDLLLSAYRVGARVSWREMSRRAVASGVDSATVGQFAEMVFTYIDELSAASVAGHHAETASADRARLIHLDRLARGLLAGQAESVLRREAELARWTPPRTMTAVLIPRPRVASTLGLLDPRTLTVEGDLPVEGPGASAMSGLEEHAVLLVPDSGGAARPRLLELLTGREAVVGPPRPWAEAAESYVRAVRATPFEHVDAEAVLPAIVLSADPQARADLREAALAPFAQLPPAKAERLAETLRAWLLLQGRRDEVAAHLHVHPQTVRYRMGQVRELYGERLNDPDDVLTLLLALA